MTTQACKKYLGTLEHYNHLVQEMHFDQQKEAAASDFSNIAVSICGLNFAIIYRIDHIIRFIIDFYRGSQKLNSLTTKYQLTPLHVAVMVENLEAVQQLLEAGATVDSLDHRNWTPLHHAALVGHGQIIEMLRAHHASEKTETVAGGTYRDILRLTEPPKKSSDTTIGLLWKDEKGDEKPLTSAEFTALTLATFIEENQIDREYLWDEWISPQSTKNELQFIEEIKKSYLESTDRPTHILSRVCFDSEGNKLLKSPGFGLYAKQALAKRAIVGEYKGVLGKNNTYNDFLLGSMTCDEVFEVNSKQFRNEIPFINDGFINLVLIPAHNVGGLPTRKLLVAAGSVAPGEQYCWNYSSMTVKLGPYVELRPKETRSFIKNEKIDELVRCLAITGSTGELSFEDFVRAEKFRYILSTPSVLFLMIFDGTLEISKGRELQKLAYTFGCIPAHAPEGLKSLMDIASSCCQLKKLVQPCFPRFTSIYTQYFSSLPARIGILDTLALAEETNEFLLKKLSSLQKDPEIKREMAGNMPYVDQAFLDLWKGEILKENELLIQKRYGNTA